MTLIDLLIIGFVIGSNNFAVALTLGALGQCSRLYRIMLVFGIFEFVVPLTGIWLGAAAAGLIGLHSNIIGGILLSGLGLLAVIDSLRDHSNDELLVQRVTSMSGLIILAAGLSLDNLLVGFSLGLVEARPLTVAGTIATFAVIFTWLGLRLGCESRRHWERPAKIAAGVLLIGLGAATCAGWF